MTRKATDFRELPGGLLIPIDDAGEMCPVQCGRCGHLAGILRNTGGRTVCIECIPEKKP